jgi:class 3 adenylate cyclase
MGRRDPALWNDEARQAAAGVASSLSVAAGLLTIGVGAFGLRFELPGYHPIGLLCTGATGVAAGLAIHYLDRFKSWTALIALISLSPFLISFGQIAYAGSPSFGPVILLWPILGAFAFLPRRWAFLIAGECLLLLGVIFAIEDGWPIPVAFWMFSAGTIAASARTTTHLVHRAKVHAERERIAREELAELNSTLEIRVEEQVVELQRLERLRRFLSPTVADAVLAAEGDSWLAPHRSEIAVLFCDLRGFTAFSAVSEPEDITDLLSRYHEIIGELVDKYDATVGGFAGDGVWLYFNDPVPVMDPAATAVRLALDLAPAMSDVAASWKRRGIEIGYGVGIALGHATLGVIGFESRREYTALGTVVNLASRLSDEARPSQILLDPRARSATEGLIASESIGELTLKGLPQPITAYVVTTK